MDAVPAWVWVAAGWCAIVPGLWLVLMGRVRRKKHGGRRCRGCGYDMAGLASLKCPECGRTAKSEREVLTRRSRTVVRLAGLALVGLGVCAMSGPRVVKHGWVGLAPDYVLAHWGPIDVSDLTRARRQVRTLYRQIGAGRNTPLPGSLLSPTPLTTGTIPSSAWREQLGEELERRITSNELSDDLVRVYLWRVFDLKAIDPAGVELPKAWPSDKVFRLRKFVPNINGSLFDLEFNADFDRRLSTSSIELDLWAVSASRRVLVSRTHRPVEVTRPMNTFMLLKDDAATNEAVTEALAPQLDVDRDSAVIKFNDRSASSEWQKVPRFTTFTFRVLLDGEVVGRGFASVNLKEWSWPITRPPALAWVEEGEERVVAHPERVELEISGAPEESVRVFMESAWTYEPEAWAGSVKVKPKVVRP